jgi:SOS-response transcriptional repressor LexA
MSQGLTEKQAALLDHLRQQSGTPTYRQIQDALGFASVSEVHRLVQGLKDRGFVETKHGFARSLRVIEPPVSLQAQLAWLRTMPSHLLHAELERRDNDPAFNGCAAEGPAVCTCGVRPGTPEARDCPNEICPLRADNREAA